MQGVHLTVVSLRQWHRTSSCGSLAVLLVFERTRYDAFQERFNDAHLRSIADNLEAVCSKVDSRPKLFYDEAVVGECLQIRYCCRVARLTSLRPLLLSHCSQNEKLSVTDQRIQLVEQHGCCFMGHTSRRALSVMRRYVLLHLVVVSATL